MTKQTQKSGGGSILVQAENIYAGISLSDAKEIFKLLWDSNIAEFQAIAKETANARAEELTDSIIEHLSKNPENIKNFQLPRHQNDLLQAQKGFAFSNGAEDLKGILAQLMSNALAEEDESGLSSIIYSEAISIAPKMPHKHFKVLSALYFYTELSFEYKTLNLTTIKILAQDISRHWEIIQLNRDDAVVNDYLHLEYLGCLRINTLSGAKFFDRIVQQYPGLFNKGYAPDQMKSMLGENTPSNVLIPCIHNPDALQIAFISEQQISLLTIDEEMKTKMIRALKGNLMSGEEAGAILQENSNTIHAIAETWGLALIHCNMTPLGKVIAGTYLSQKISLPPLVI